MFLDKFAKNYIWILARYFLRLFFAYPIKFFADKPNLNSLNYSEFTTNMNKAAIGFKKPELIELGQSYVLIRNLDFHPKDINFNLLEKIENFVKWKFLNLHFTLILKNHPLQFLINTFNFAKDKLRIKTDGITKKINDRDVNISKKIKITEEIIQMKPYSRSLQKQKLFKLPISKTPLYKSYFSDEEMKRFREELAAQNNLRRTSVEIFEIYDKFNVRLYSDIRQSSASRNLLCYPNFQNADIKLDDDFYYLIIGKRRDTNETIKALSRPTVKE